MSYRKTDPFKFHLQEEKLNDIKKLSNRTLKPPTNSDINNLYPNSVHQSILLDSKNNREEVQNTNVAIDQNNDYLKNLIDKFKTEINQLKSYINRINKEVRKKLNIEIPLLLDNNSDNNESSENLAKFYNESLNRLLNVEYLNPIFSLYDNHILDVENELAGYKSLVAKYEARMTELIKENEAFRDNYIIKCNEIKEILKMKVQSNSLNVVYDEEYIKTLEERSNLLSKENEILAINFQKAAKDLFDYNLNVIEKHKESLEKIDLYDTVVQEMSRVNIHLDNALVKNTIFENKITDLAELISHLEIDRENIRQELDRMRNENKTLLEANNFYKVYIHKNNNL